jgi:hypothetical protein
MPPIEVSHPETKKLYHKALNSRLVEGDEMGKREKSSASERFYGILKISDTAVIDEIAERDQFD